MRDALFHLPKDGTGSIQARIRSMLVDEILAGRLPAGDPLPSSRRMAQTLGVSRNTVVLAYQALVDDGYLQARERSGFYVDPDIGPRVRKAEATPHRASQSIGPDVDWASKLRIHPSEQSNVTKPKDWQRFPYPFIYGQVDTDLFPLSSWRECFRLALNRKTLDAWTADARADDDPVLIEQIRTRLLPRRGLLVDSDQILITLGAQNALYILASLLISPKDAVVIEEPGYRDATNIISLKTNNVRPVPVDAGGLQITQAMRGAKVAFVTPSHQYPTAATMPMDRRMALLESATKNDVILIEDDYEAETNFINQPMPSLASLDTSGRTLYIGSLSKTLFPGLRLGYLVGPKALITEARALRRLMLRHAPSNVQYATAQFLALGHHDALVHRLHKAYRARWQAMEAALKTHLPDITVSDSVGGTSVWCQGSAELDTDKLALAAAKEGILIDPGTIYFHQSPPPRNCFRLGFSSIPLERIEPGIEKLSNVLRAMEQAH